MGVVFYDDLHISIVYNSFICDQDDYDVHGPHTVPLLTKFSVKENHIHLTSKLCYINPCSVYEKI